MLSGRRAQNENEASAVSGRRQGGVLRAAAVFCGMRGAAGMAVKGFGWSAYAGAGVETRARRTDDERVGCGGWFLDRWELGR